jgi:hypothetical protein
MASLGSMLLYWYHYSHNGRRIEVETDDDSIGGHFLHLLHGQTPSALWERAFSPPGGVRAWYALGAAYWFRVAADDDGMLGGLAAETNAVDTAASMALLRALAARGMGGGRGKFIID